MSLPSAVRDLVARSFWATFRVSPRPQSLGESMQIYADLKAQVAEHGTIVHYKQAVCPVTKERLETLQMLVEDHAASSNRIDAVYNGEKLTPDLTPLEAKLLGKYRNQRVELRSITRDYERYKDFVHK